MKNMRELLVRMEGDGRISYEIGHRGGWYRTTSSTLVEELFRKHSPASRALMLEKMPQNFGAFCNYLGGGIRGAVCRSSFSEELPKSIKAKLDDFGKECVRRYLELEREWLDSGDAFTDEWNEEATRKVRANGIISAF